MKVKLKEFEQHLYHFDVENNDKAEGHLDDALSMIGCIVMFFNSLESTLDHVLCENFTDRTDSMGLIVLNKMSVGAKVELFKRFCDDLHLQIGSEVEGYGKLLNDLGDSIRLRNLIVHADWETTDDEGYTYVGLKMSKTGMRQEYRQFTPEALQEISELLIHTRVNIYKYWERATDVFYGRDPGALGLGADK
ncbi:hypothetical protein [Saccharospirillum impatiens]|uniref:hypothetical protein n=1 Tax=Saccharospirillum impatiens TaxID=169438 RepID=UPI00048D0D4E|nr:hypothetical protein [Saccharospirillum impatiens]